jgi:TRAP-type C4-dicarboxylate transport system permease small subunit
MSFPDRLEQLSLLIEKIAGMFLAIIALLVFVSAIGRYLLAMPVPDAFDISRLMMGVAVMWGFASVGYRGSHIKVDLIAEVLPHSIRRWVDTFAWLVLLLFTVLLAWKLFGRVDSTFSSGESTFDLRIPVWPFLAVIWLGVVASVLTVCARIVLLVIDRQSSLDHFDSAEDAEDADQRV